MASTKYEALYRTLREQIRCGELSAGQKLPSKRVMAERSGYSVLTVQRAYGMLADEGYLVARERSGYFVCAPQELFIGAAPPVCTDDLPLPDPSAAPAMETSVWFKTVRKVMSEQGERLFTKAPSMGCAVLRNAVAGHLRRYRGMQADPARIVIGSGAEQLYETAVKLLGRDKVFGIEDPCYARIPAAYLGMGAAVRPLAMGPDGIRTRALHAAPFDVLHVTPFHSYPSGATAPLAKRYQYLQWAQQDGRYIIEDDFDSEFYMPRHPIESLYSLDRSDRVIYINTFSKSISPAVRIGYMILPAALAARYEQQLGQQPCSVPVMDQYVLAEFIASGSFERHLNRARRKQKGKDL